MRIGVLGINHKLADLKLRELLAQACQKHFSPIRSMHDQQHFILLSTCNRTEIYFSSEDLAATHTYLLNIFRKEVPEDFDQKLYSYFGCDCFHHLSRVAAGLDSAIVAETEIQGQVKKAYEHYTQFYTLPQEMHYLFQKALRIGKKVRSMHLLNRGLPEIEHAILNSCHHFFKNSYAEAKILFVGVSDINQKILHFFKCKNLNNITVCNRSKENAMAWAQTYQLKVLEWTAISTWLEFDWIIFGTKSPQHLIDSNQSLPHHMGTKLIFDLSVPRNVDPDIARHPKVILLNIDQINRMLIFRKQKTSHIITEAEQYVSEATRQQALLFKQKQENRERLMAVGA